VSRDIRRKGQFRRCKESYYWGRKGTGKALKKNGKRENREVLSPEKKEIEILPQKLPGRFPGGGDQMEMPEGGKGGGHL